MHQWFEWRLLSGSVAGDRIMKSRILIVEDEKTALHALSLLLSDEGYEISQADRGEQGLRLAMREEPDLLLLDIRLPDLDGLTVLERLRAGPAMRP